MSLIRSVLLGCVFALLCGATVSVLLLVGLDQLTKLSRRFEWRRTGPEAVRSGPRSDAQPKPVDAIAIATALPPLEDGARAA